MVEQLFPQDQHLEQLLASRRNDNYHYYLGRIEIFWGFFNILGIWLYTLLLPHVIFWALWIPLGVVSIGVWALRLYLKARPRVPASRALQLIWSFALLCIPLIVVVFPHLGLFALNYAVIFTLVMIWVAFAFLATSVSLGQTSQYLSFAVFLGSAPFFYFWPTLYPWIFSVASFFGLAVPGWWCLHESHSA